MKLHRNLAAFFVKDFILLQELEALAAKEGLHLVKLTDELLVADTEAGERLFKLLEKKDYFPRNLAALDDGAKVDE